MTPPTPDPIHDAAVSLRVLLQHLLERAQEAVTSCEETRAKLRKNVEDLLKSQGSTPPGEVLDELVHRTQALFGEDGEVRVGPREGLGRGVTATKAAADTEGDFITVTACVTGDLETGPITGGGLEMLFAYHG